MKDQQKTENVYDGRSSDTRQTLSHVFQNSDSTGERNSRYMKDQMSLLQVEKKKSLVDLEHILWLTGSAEDLHRLTLTIRGS